MQTLQCFTDLNAFDNQFRKGDFDTGDQFYWIAVCDFW